MANGELLENLAKKGNCFISSLKDPSKRKQVFAALLQIDPGQYSLEEWNYCISYLIGHRMQFTEAKDIREFIKETSEEYH